MATIIKKSASRIRSEVKIITDPVLANVETSYNAYEAAKAAVTTETWSVKVVTAYYDVTLTQHVLIAEGTWIERYDDNVTPLP
jgi:hypothetical protein